MATRQTLAIRRLALENFRSYSSAEFDPLGARVLIIGENNAGKSTIRNAIAWALLGVCEGLDAAGRGVAALVHVPNAPMRVELDAVGVGRIVRSVDAKGKIDLQVLRVVGEGVDEVVERLASGGVKDVQGWILDKLGVSPEVLAAVLDYGAFLALDHASAKATLLGVLNVRVAFEGANLTLAQLDQAEQTARENRQLAKRELAAAGTPREPQEPVGRPRAALRADLAAFEMDGEESFGASNRRVGERDQVQRQIEQLQAEERRLASRLANADLDALRTSIDRDVLALAGLTFPDQAADLKAAADAADAAGRLSNLARLIDAITAHAPAKGCVIDASIPCRTPATYFRKAVDGLRDDRDQLQAEVQAGAQAAEARDAMRRRRQDLTEQIAAARARVALLQGDQDRLDVVRAELMDKAQTVDDLGRAIAADGEKSRGAGAKVETIKAALAEWDAYDQRMAEYTRATAAIDRLRERIAALETRCEQLGPNGLRVAALTEALGAFQRRVNAYLVKWDRQVEIQAEPWQVRVSVAGGPFRPASVLSKSERMRTGIALQLAIAATSGVGFAFIDECEMLDAKNNAALAALLLSNAGGQIFVASTRDASWPTPNIDGLVAIRVGLDSRSRSRVVENTAALAISTP